MRALGFVSSPDTATSESHRCPPLRSALLCSRIRISGSSSHQRAIQIIDVAAQFP
jgi:hypothetical protein